MIFYQYLKQLQHCAKRQTPLTARQLHAQLIKLGIHKCEPLPNTLVNVYGKCGHVESALKVFDEMPQRDQVTWASILTAHNQARMPEKALSMFTRMIGVDRLQPDHFVFACLVKACGGIGDARIGRQVHGKFAVSGYFDDDVVKSSLVDMYAKCGMVDDAWKVFDSIGVKNSVSWTAMISGYARGGRKEDAIGMFRKVTVKNLFTWTALVSGLVQSGNCVDAFDLFLEMRREGVDIVDPLVLSSIVGASASLAALDTGKQIHCLVVCLGYDSCLFISNALIDMYAKCSDFLAASVIFNRMRRKDVVSWTSMIVGAAQHGKAEEALTLYDEMNSAGVKPNEVTFVGLIYACSHVGLVDKGRALFNSMSEDYGISPSLQHYTCFLDLLSRSGHLGEAERLIRKMPFEPDEPTWAAFLSACKKHGNTEIAIRVADHLLNLKPEDPSTYILLSNIYAGAAAWENVSKVRKLMGVLDVKKKPGYSCIDLGREKQLFYAGETTHPLKDQIIGLLKELDAEMRRRGYIPDTSFVLHDMEQQEKERLLFLHSERLAVAYGLLKAFPGVPIRIVKNLRVCGDCHTVLKYISCITGRELIVRDANRYHHFRDGKCSCNEFW